MRQHAFPAALPPGLLASTLGEAPPIDFTPVPRKRRRRDGWTDQRQRDFIFALGQCGSVSAAARHVGMSSRSAYRLLDSEGAIDFGRAWDEAIDQGIERTRSDAIQRALYGAMVPIYRRGKLHSIELRRSDRLALGLLGGRAMGGASGAAFCAEDRAAHRADQRRYSAANPGFAQRLIMEEIVSGIEATCARRRAELMIAEQIALGQETDD